MNDYSLITEFRKFAPAFLKIKDERGNIIPLNFNYAQEKTLSVIEDLQKRGKPIRLIVLKARQVGISTMLQGWTYHWNSTHLNQRALTMGHKVDASNNLFDIYKRYYDNVPKALQPMIEKSNEKKVSFRKLKSENKVDTAGSGEVGRSDTFQVLHLTEVAFYPDAKTTLLGLLQGAKYAVAQFIESTANGLGNLFHSMWVDAIEGNSDFVPIFISWLEFPTYKRDFENEDERKRLEIDLGNSLFNEYENEERMLLEQGATLEQLNWRRWAIKNLCQNSVSQFHQEYPTTWQEAFVSTGRPVFPANICNKNKADALEFVRSGRKPLRIGDLVVKYDKDIYNDLKSRGIDSYEGFRPAIEKIEFIENSRGFIKIWSEIKTDGSYRFASGVDVAEGLEQGDRSVIRILDRESNEVVLTWVGHIDPDLFAEEIHKLWLFLNKNVTFAIERNNHGLTVINKCFKLDVDMYYRQNFSKGYEKQSHDIGFQTNVKTKPMMVNDMTEWIREGLFKDYEPEFWDECLTFVKNSRGQMQAEGKDTDPSSKCYDDRVMAGGIMIVCTMWLPNFIPAEEMPRYARSYVTKIKANGDAKF